MKTELFQRETRVDKPWGYELIWAQTPRYVGKILHINEGHRLSYQYHRLKDETIRLLSGRLDVETEVDGERKTFTMKDGECLHIPPLMRHRLIAVKDCDVLEVSTPELTDVERLEDDYNRQHLSEK